jgi:hypothetical protein
MATKRRTLNDRPTTKVLDDVFSPVAEERLLWKSTVLAVCSLHARQSKERRYRVRQQQVQMQVHLPVPAAAQAAAGAVVPVVGAAIRALAPCDQRAVARSVAFPPAGPPADVPVAAALVAAASDPLMAPAPHPMLRLGAARAGVGANRVLSLSPAALHAPQQLAFHPAARPPPPPPAPGAVPAPLPHAVPQLPAIAPVVAPAAAGARSRRRTQRGQPLPVVADSLAPVAAAAGASAADSFYGDEVLDSG